MKFLRSIVPLVPLGGVWGAMNDGGLLPLVFEPIPLGSIKPLGWIKDQLQLMADGLAGHEHEFYRYVANSTWIGRTEEYSSLDEAWPYWINGIVPLAYSLDDERLKAKVKESIDYIFDHQQADGWIGPETTPQRRFFWPRTLVLYAVTQYLEAEPSQAASIIPKLYKYMELSRTMLADNYLGYISRNDSVFDYHWGITRSHDMLVSLQWLYDYYPAGNEKLLLEVMNYFNDGGWDWAYFYSKEVFPFKDLELYPEQDPTGDLFWYYHGVNSAMGLKSGAVVRRLTHNESLLQIGRQGADWSFEYHGSPAGSLIGDEPWIGLSPTRASELCTTVEAMFSLGYLFRAFGNNKYADKAELAAFNALPAAMSPDWWAHQYVTQTNQPFSNNLTANPWSDVNTIANTFGLEPNYPCCTVNHPQGYPKFLSASYVKIGNDGIGHFALIPSELSTTLYSNETVNVTCKTSYPFENVLQYTIKTAKPFSFYVRVPEWAVLAESSVQKGSAEKLPLQPDAESGFHKILIPAGTTQITYTIGTEIAVETRANDTVTIRHGALLYALDIGENITTAAARAGYAANLIADKWLTPESHDYRISNTTAWNIAIDPSTLKYSSKGSALPNPLFTSGAPPGSITGKGCQINWGLYQGTAAPPDQLFDRSCIGGFFDVTLIPYGAAKLHMAQFPTVDSKA